MEIVIYGKSNKSCKGCEATKFRLDGKLAAPYTFYNIDESDPDYSGYQHRDKCLSYGYMSAPVVVIRDNAGNDLEHWSGFNPFALDRWAKKVKAETETGVINE